MLRDAEEKFGGVPESIRLRMALLKRAGFLKVRKNGRFAIYSKAHPSVEAKQGHRYRFDSVDVIALESGPVVKVGVLSRGDPWFVRKERVSAERLKPLPMVYFYGDVPR